jgi:hypothetical protein
LSDGTIDIGMLDCVVRDERDRTGRASFIAASTTSTSSSPTSLRKGCGSASSSLAHLMLEVSNLTLNDITLLVYYCDLSVL